MKSVSHLIKVTLIEELQHHDRMGRVIHHLNETTFYPKNMEELSYVSLGRHADRIWLYENS